MIQQKPDEQCASCLDLAPRPGALSNPRYGLCISCAQGHFELVIKGYPDGNVSQHMFGLKVGDMVEVGYVMFCCVCVCICRVAGGVTRFAGETVVSVRGLC